MSIEIFDVISNNAVFSGVAILVLAYIVKRAHKFIRDWRDGSAIYQYLAQSSIEADWRFRTTHAISAATKLSEARVQELCIGHSKISRNQLEKQSWRVDA